MYSKLYFKTKANIKGYTLARSNQRLGITSIAWQKVQFKLLTTSNFAKIVKKSLICSICLDKCRTLATRIWKSHKICHFNMSNTNLNA